VARTSSRKKSDVGRSTSPGQRLPPSSRQPHNSEHRRPRPGSEDAQAQGQSSEPLASRSRRRRESENSVLLASPGVSSEMPPPRGQPAVEHPHSAPAENDLLDQIGQMRPTANSAFSRATSHEEASRQPPSRRGSGGPGDCSLLVPPANDASRSVSPNSSAGSSSASPGPSHRRTVLDPIARPRGPPLPSAGRLLLAAGQQDSREPSPQPR